MLITLVYLCIDENIFHVFFISCMINVCIYIQKMYLLIVYLLYDWLLK
jgi:hypothetical protein